MTLAERFRNELVEEGLWIPTDVAGIFGRSGTFEAIVSGFDAMIVKIARSAGAQPISFPPVVSRDLIRDAGYMESFPELCGSIHSFRPSTASHQALVDRVSEGGDWGEYLEQMPLTLCPAACYPLYPTCRGILPPAGLLYDLCSYVFRAEPSDDPGRLQMFRMRENVRIGDRESVVNWRQEWTSRATQIFESLGLPIEVAIASDPFFGRGGKLLAANQRADEAKFEILCPVALDDELTAIASFNLHRDKFSRAFDIRLQDGTYAETACVGFGLERIALALLRAHGFKIASWPAEVRERISL